MTLAIVTVPLTVRAADTIRGRVLDMRSGQGIQKARVSIGDASTITDELGRFELSRPGVDPTAELTVSAVGYGVVRRTVAPLAEDLEIRLGQDAVQHAEAVDVSVSVFDTRQDEPLAQTIQGVELRNLSNVVTDDALRSVQALPGVTASDDLYASFALRGWGFENTGLYIDGVLISSPFHTIRGINDGGYSLTMLNNDLIEDVTLLNGGAPVAYGDRVGGTLRIETRDGSREKTTVRTSFGAAGASFVAEGPMGGANTSWLLGARKSFLDYVVQALDDEPSFVVGYHDIQAKFTHRSGRGSLSLFLAAGDSTFRDEEQGQQRNDVGRASADTRLASLRWRHTPSPHLSFTAAAFFTRETGRNRNAQGEGLLDSASNQAGGRFDFMSGVGDSHTLQAGLISRRLDGKSADTTYPRSGAPQQRAFDESQWQHGAYLQDTWRTPGGKLTLTAGVRTDQSTAVARTVVFPRLSGALRLGKDTTLSFASGGYAQFPTLDQLFGRGVRTALLPERSDHYQVSLEHRFSPATRVRVDLYDQEERDRLMAGPEIRRVNGLLVLPGESALANSLSGRANGIEITVQRRGPNGVTGWLSYGLGRTRVTDAQTNQRFDSDHDQRHTVSAYLSYRLSHRTNFSVKFRFGSGPPAAGYFEETATGHRVSDRRNLLRLPAYSRLDVRANRTFSIRRARLTLYTEILNILNHANQRDEGTSILIPSGQVFFDRASTFPLLPAAGITIEW
jgi:outer membrane receptor for ferrienterochelin and colicin